MMFSIFAWRSSSDLLEAIDGAALGETKRQWSDTVTR
jgi:hypothetical protein